jgi:hypothetical protein
VGLVMAACNHGSKPTAPGCCDRPESARPEAGSSEARARLEAGATTPSPAGPRFRKEEGCARDFKPSVTASQDLAELARLCGQGMAPLFTEAASAVSGGVEVPFRITSAGCFRAAVVAAQAGLSMSLLDPQGVVLAAGSSAEPFALVPVDGNVCVREPGDYRAIVRMSIPREPRPASSMTIQVWQASRD